MAIFQKLPEIARHRLPMLLALASLPLAVAGADPPAWPGDPAGMITNLTTALVAGTTNAGGANSPLSLGTVVVAEDLDAAREQIAPSLGAVTYTISPNQIQTMGQGESSSFQQVLLQAPGVVQEEFGEVHVRGDHGDLQYRVNGVLLPESLN
ncbi:MAG: hypothetical protein ABSF38_04740, partial [Verrucomicrobiota bacterium]